MGIGLFALVTDTTLWFLAAAVMGLGTAMVYPTFLAAMSDLAHPTWRASALGVYRLWRDSGYAFGALLGGVLSDIFSIQIAVLIIAVLTLFSGILTAIYLPETVRLSHVPVTTSELSPTSQDVA
jgi:MFS family permease